MHSKADSNTPYVQTEELHRIYTGPKQLWLTEKGDHALLWSAQSTEYEKRLSNFLL